MPSKRMLLVCVAIVFASVFNSCKKENPVILQETALQNADYRIMHVAYYRELKGMDGDGIGVRLFETPVILNLYRSNPDFDAVKTLIDKSQNEHSYLRIYTDVTEVNKMQSAIPVSTQEMAQYEATFTKKAPVTSGTPKYFIYPNMTKLNAVFDYMAAQGCATSTVEIDQCISFQYVVDGCYARAHKMKQVMNEKYGYGCQKIFSYEGAAGYLAVDAGDCCVYWWYHVAPYVSVVTPEGIKKYVMDPSMFDHVVTADEWTGAQENFDCTPYADFGYSEITPGNIYTPGGGTDDTYYWTNSTLNLYSTKETCE